jgi:hypothetical protein
LARLAGVGHGGLQLLLRAFQLRVRVCFPIEALVRYSIPTIAVATQIRIRSPFGSYIGRSDALAGYRLPET